MANRLKFVKFLEFFSESGLFFDSHTTPLSAQKNSVGRVALPYPFALLMQSELFYPQSLHAIMPVSSIRVIILSNVGGFLANISLERIIFLQSKGECSIKKQLYVQTLLP